MNIQQIKTWWETKKLPQEKSGSFNLELYLQILKIKSYEKQV